MRSIRRQLVVVVVTGVMLGGCGKKAVSGGHPNLKIGEDVCAECGMVINDERFAVATMVFEKGSTSPFLFDDLNCQGRYLGTHEELGIVSSWCHDYNDKSWLDANRAGFLQSNKIKTPVGSGIAAFGSSAALEDARKQFGGRVLDWSKVTGLFVPPSTEVEP